MPPNRDAVSQNDKQHPAEIAPLLPRRIAVSIVPISTNSHQGTLHEVMVVPGGFCWQDKTYQSLSTIAQAITGTSWNGPRFFGLRGGSSTEAAVERASSLLLAVDCDDIVMGVGFPDLQCGLILRRFMPLV
jgi:hypothetical protein